MALEKEIMNRKFKWIFFDLDGTLADSIPPMYQVYLNFLTEFDKRGTKEEFDELNGPSLPEIVSVLKTRYRLVDDKNFLMDLYKGKMLGAYKNYVKPIDGENDILQELKNRGFVKSLRKGPTGIGLTFETLMGVEENNLALPDIDGLGS